MFIWHERLPVEPSALGFVVMSMLIERRSPPFYFILAALITKNFDLQSETGKYISMPRLIPIQAITYNTNHGKDLSTRIAPPYDILDEEPKQNLLRRDSYNVVAIDLPVTPPKTVGPDEAYANAGQVFRDWLSQGILKQDSTPAIYAYQQVFTVHEQTQTRRGLIASVGLEPFNRPEGGIFRHELTIATGVDDRYKLMQAAQAQFSPIFGIFSDPKNDVATKLSGVFEGSEPDFFGTTSNDDVLHQVWRIDDEALIAALQHFFVTTDVFIADGHHRYTTALQFHQDHPESDKTEKCLFMLVAAQDPGMIVMPTHRVLDGLTNLTVEKLKEACDHHEGIKLERTDFGPEQLDMLAHNLSNHEYHAMGLYIPGQDKLFRLRYFDPDPLGESHSDKPKVWRQLDVAILHHLFVEQVLASCFTADTSDTLDRYHYTADLNQLKWITETGHGSNDRLGVILQPTPLHSVMDVSKANEVMPAKSTFFYPKIATGLILNPLT